MSRRIDTIVIEPVTHGNLDWVQMDPIECPDCNGVGYHREEKSRNEFHIKICKRCSGAQKIKAITTINWLPAHDIHEIGNLLIFKSKTMFFMDNLEFIEKSVTEYEQTILEIESISQDTLIIRRPNDEPGNDRDFLRELIQGLIQQNEQ